MSTKECCRTCKYCCFNQGQSDGWCRLRQINVHKEIVQYALCHHWTQRAPSLPSVKEKAKDVLIDMQLEFSRTLVGNDKY